MPLAEPFLILGASKTGTSTAVAVANAHPQVFCLFECDFSKGAREGRTGDIVRLLPEVENLFGNATAFKDGLTRIAAALAKKRWSYTHLGTKVQGLRADLLTQVRDLPVLFMVRDARLWAAKNRVITDVFRANQATNIVPFLVAYADYYLRSFSLERCVRLSFDSTCSRDLTVFPRAMARVLDLPQAPFERWWQTAAQWKITAPKNYSTWTEGHASAFVPPLYADTKATLAEHPFWGDYLPLFDKYFADPARSFPAGEIDSDRATLQRLGGAMSMTVDEAFAQFHSYRMGALTPTEDRRVSVSVRELVHKERGHSWVESKPQGDGQG